MRPGLALARLSGPGLLAILGLACAFAAARGGEPVVVGFCAATVVIAAAGTWAATSPARARRATSSAPALPATARWPRVFFLGGLLLIGQLTLRPVRGITASDWLFLVALLLAGVLLPLRLRSLPRLPTGVAAGAVLFAIGAAVSAFGSATTAGAASTVVRFVYLTTCWLWAAAVALPRRTDVELGARAWILSIAVSSAAALVQLTFGDVVPGSSIAFGRMTGTAQHVSDLGGSTAVALPTVLGLALFRQRAARRAAWGALLVLVTLGLLLSGSVGGMIAAAVGAVTTAVLARRGVSFAVVLAGIAAVVIVATHLQVVRSDRHATVLARVTSVSAPTGTLAARVAVYRQAWQRVEHDPAVGVGFGFDPRRAGSRITDLIHNAYLSTWYQGGLLALAGLLVMGLSALRTMFAAVRRLAGNDRLLAASLTGSFVSYLFFGLGEPTLYVRYGWVPAALGLALAAQLRHGWGGAA